MDTSLPPAEELVLVDRELAQLDARRTQLLARRAWLVRALYPPVPVAAPYGPGPAPADSTPRSAQNVLLTLGGTLLTIAAIAFTLVSWGSMGIGGRAAVLSVVTSAALAVPVALLRKGLVSTGESVAALGLVLMVLDAYALHRAALEGTGGLGYTAVASAVLAGAWTAYGSALSRLRIPLPAAVVAAQLPLPLGVLAADGGPTAFAWAALVTAAGDVAVALWARPAAVRVTAVVGAVTLGGWALVTGGWLSLVAPWRGAPLLLTGAALVLYAAWRRPALAVPAGALAGLAATASLGGLLRAAVPSDWAVPGYVLCGLALAAVWHLTAPGAPEAVPSPADDGTDAAGGRAWPPRGVRLGLGVAGAGIVGLGVVWALPPVAAGLLGPMARTTAVWSGEHTDGALASFPGTAALVLLVAAAALAAVPRLRARCGALVLAWALLTALPVSLELPYGVTLALQLVTTAAAMAVAVRPGVLVRGLPPRPEAPAPAPAPAAPVPGTWGPRPPAAPAKAVEPGTVLGWSAYAVGLASAGSALALSLDVRAATFTVLGAVLALLAAVAVAGEGGRRVASGCLAVLAATGLVLAAAAAAELEDQWTALAVLGIPAATAAVGARVRRGPAVLAVEVTGASVGLLALGFTEARPEFLALVLALGGVIAAATAVRPERRRFASWTAAVLFLLATWVRLGASEVSAPEAYSLPVTVPALVVGYLRRRRDPETSSWTAYGPGLAATLLPSLVAAWTDPDWVRPLLLGAAALVVTLLGARFRLQALLVLGGVTLALDGLHELAPYVVQVVGALPRWLPPAVAGLLLLAVGATYEQRLRDARRLRERLARMR
ncbi:hypothetical protein AB0G79_26580 [Streptomyces sp. NPDC020807]|uniref:SCO7613 C-terminal domain-containing membrane protein n=1 Tax=Streptomyces sp. NPDC020807 TaxID=3155119 RepID=UPI0033C8CD11